jgi:hypothetical protein
VSKKSDELVERVIGTLKLLVDSDKWPLQPEQMRVLVDAAVTGWTDEINDEIETLIKEWESRMPDDTTLYSLGVRRAQDILRGNDSLNEQP